MVFWAGVLLVGLISSGGIALAANSEGKPCAEWDGLKTIRGFCPEEYLRLDVLDEVGRAAKDLASETYFPLVIRRADAFSFAVQIRHDEEPLRSRKWRGEFLIVVRDERPGLAAVFARAKQPLWAQIHALVHEKHYKVIAEAFERTALAAGDKAWAEEVKHILPPVDKVVEAIQIERLATDSKTCPVLAQHVGALTGLRPEPVFEKESDETISVAVHPEIYEVVIARYPRVLYTTDHDPQSVFFKWAEDTVQALEPCWKPAAP